ncbi:MAG: class I SAM-dependent methyltransferase [Sulfuricellaceae bacterium]
MSVQQSEWDDSYKKKDNFVFYPHEEVIRFVSKYIRKRIGLHEFRDVAADASSAKILDFGCGIGRHVIFCHELGLSAYGIDLSQEAINVALQWTDEKGLREQKKVIVQGDVRHLPWDEGFFDFALSHGVLDSMHFDVAKQACAEVARVMKKGGLFYCDLVSGDDSSHAREFAEEEIVTTEHETGTIQSYFNYSKLVALISDYFDIVECKLIRNENVHNGIFISRWHLVLKNK